MSAGMKIEKKYRCNSEACEGESSFHELIGALSFKKTERGIKEAFAECPKCWIGIIKVDVSRLAL